MKSGPSPEKLVIGVAFYGIKFTFADTNLQENSSASDAGTELQREDSSEMGYHEVIPTIKIYLRNFDKLSVSLIDLQRAHWKSK